MHGIRKDFQLVFGLCMRSMKVGVMENRQQVRCKARQILNYFSFLMEVCQRCEKEEPYFMNYVCFMMSHPFLRKYLGISIFRTKQEWHITALCNTIRTIQENKINAWGVGRLGRDFICCSYSNFRSLEFWTTPCEGATLCASISRSAWTEKRKIRLFSITRDENAT